MNEIEFIVNRNARSNDKNKTCTTSFSPHIARSVRRFHESFPAYLPTPLVRLGGLARYLGVKTVMVKDESRRFGLNAFKALGTTYALGRIIAKRLRLPDDDLTYAVLTSPEVRRLLQGVVVATATDGNHGRGLAWAAREMGCRAVVFVPRGTSAARKNAIRKLGAELVVVPGTYDEAVARAAERSAREGWTLVQDTAWDGYTEIPETIMQGYLTIMDEVMEQTHGVMPGHMLVQCGVGSLAAAMQAYVVEAGGAMRPVFAVVEPIAAACFFASIRRNCGCPKTIEGAVRTIMAGLACGTPSIIAWNILRDYADIFVACSDAVSVSGMRVLGNPRKGDVAVVSGESGAVTVGVLVSVTEQQHPPGLKDALALNEDADVLLISTEGDTDPASYRRIIGID